MNRKKLLAIVACECAILVALVTGTIAWLTAETDPIVNTFKPSNISVTLVEDGANNNAQEFQMIPGKSVPKKATVTVTNDIDCYVFIKVDEDLGAWTAGGKKFTDYITYSVASGWIELEDGVYYREITTTGNHSFGVLTGDSVTVSSDVTKADMDKLNTQGAAKPTLTFTAYVCQKESGNGYFSAAEAWALAEPAQAN